MTDDDQIQAALTAETIAVVGCSRTPGKPAHDVPAYLDRHGYEIVPVNPFADTILGRTAVDTLSGIDEQVDLVCVFRPSEEVAGIVDDALARPDVETIWLQLGISDEEAAERARAQGVRVIANRCMKVDHRRLSG